MLTGSRIVVIGAGVAGLAAARALALRGAEVTVLEQADAIREVGAGLQIAPNGARVLNALGLGESLARLGQLAEAAELIDGETGGRVARLPLADASGSVPFAPAYRFVHRADLIALLLDGAREAGAEVRTGAQVVRIDLGDDRPAVSLADGGRIIPDLLVGADGLHSPLREVLNGRVAPFFTHQVAWRATLPAEGPIDPVARVYLGPGRHLVTYPLRGSAMRNIVAVEERRTWAEESWSLTDDPLALRIAFEDFVPEVRGWLDRIERPNLWGLFRHPVARTWHGSNAAILGDAAHPTLPFLAQGANLALEDAWVLAEALDRHEAPPVAFAAFQAARQARVTRAVAAADANARNYHLAGLKRDVAHMGLRMLSRVAPARLAARFDWLYAHDVTGGQGG
jgi:salicylate hydroxylase